MSVSILLAGDHRMVRQGLRALLEAQPNLLVVGEAGTGLRALDLTRQLKPDVLVVDIGMPGLDGLEVTRRVKKRFPRTRMIVLTMHADEWWPEAILLDLAPSAAISVRGLVSLAWPLSCSCRVVVTHPWDTPSSPVEYPSGPDQLIFSVRLSR